MDLLERAKEWKACANERRPSILFMRGWRYIKGNIKYMYYNDIRCNREIGGPKG